MQLSNISVNVKDQMLKEVDRLADCLDRTRSWVVNEALDEFLARQEGILASIQKSLKEADGNRGGGRAHTDVAEAARKLLRKELGK
jgi:RHH-type rel operon transcriptional repressor/antitoxin RelB